MFRLFCAMAFKIPESVLVVVHTPRLDVLLLERAQGGLWQSVTGSRELDDADLEATARREVREETGLQAGTLTDWRQVNRYEIWAQWRARYAPGVTHNTEHAFGFTVPERFVASLDPAEHLAIGRALMSRPTLLLLDEPSLGLAPRVARQLFEQLRSLNAQTGTAMLVVDQMAGLALELAARAYLLRDGEIVAAGSSAEMAASPALRQAYLAGGPGVPGASGEP